MVLKTEGLQTEMNYFGSKDHIVENKVSSLVPEVVYDHNTVTLIITLQTANPNCEILIPKTWWPKQT